MKKIYLIHLSLFTFLLCSSIDSYAQNAVQDEFNRLEILCKKHTRTPDSLLFYSKELLDFSQKHKLENGEKTALRYLGKSHSRLKNYEKSNHFYYRALTISKRSSDVRTAYQIYNDLSLNHRATKYYDSAVYYSLKLITHLKGQKDQRFLNLAYMNTGISLYLKSKLDSAQYYLSKANEGFKESNNLRLLSNNLGMLGEIQFQKKKYKEALVATDSSQKIAERINNKSIYRRNYNLLARIHERLNNHEESENYSELALKKMSKSMDNYDIRDMNESVGKSRYKQNMIEIQKLKANESFYKSTLFKILFFTVFLLLISHYLYRRYKKTQKEVALLQEKLDLLAKRKVKEATKLLYLKCKAVIDIAKILFIKSEGHYLEFHVDGKNKPEIDRNSLTKILEELPSDRFVRIHKSYVVNINYIKIINSTKVMLNNGKWINLSRTYKQQLKDILQIK